MRSLKKTNKENRKQSAPPPPLAPADITTMAGLRLAVPLGGRDRGGGPRLRSCCCALSASCRSRASSVAARRSRSSRSPAAAAPSRPLSKQLPQLGCVRWPSGASDGLQMRRMVGSDDAQVGYLIVYLIGRPFSSRLVAWHSAQRHATKLLEGKVPPSHLAQSAPGFDGRQGGWGGVTEK